MSGDGLHLLKKLGYLETSAIQGATGRWFLVGKVPVTAGYERKDGAPLTQDDIKAICQCGPGALGATILYGAVFRAGPKAFDVVWESGNRNRIRRDEPRGVKLCEREPDETAVRRLKRAMEEVAK